MNKSSYDPNAECKKCLRLRLPSHGHWASDCPNTICPICRRTAPGHYRWTCPSYFCTICETQNPRHKTTQCPKYPEHVKKIEDMKARANLQHQPYSNPRDAFDDDYYDDGVSLDYSTLSA